MRHVKPLPGQQCRSPDLRLVEIGTAEQVLVARAGLFERDPVTVDVRLWTFVGIELSRAEMGGVDGPFVMAGGGGPPAGLTHGDLRFSCSSAAVR